MVQALRSTPTSIDESKTTLSCPRLSEICFFDRLCGPQIKLYRFNIDRFRELHASRLQTCRSRLSLSGCHCGCYQAQRRTNRTHRVFDPQNERLRHGFRHNIKGPQKPRHRGKGLRVLENLTHHAGAVCEQQVGAMAGILIQIPDAFSVASAEEGVKITLPLPLDNTAWA